MRQINDGQCSREKKHSPLQPPSASSPLILQFPVRPHPALHVTLHHVLHFASSSTEPLKQENRLIPSSCPPTHGIKSLRGSPPAPMPMLPLYPEPLPPPRPIKPNPKNLLPLARIHQNRKKNEDRPAENPEPETVPGRKIVRFFEDHAARRCSRA